MKFCVVSLRLLKVMVPSPFSSSCCLLRGCFSDPGWKIGLGSDCREMLGIAVGIPEIDAIHPGCWFGTFFYFPFIGKTNPI